MVVCCFKSFYQDGFTVKGQTWVEIREGSGTPIVYSSKALPHHLGNKPYLPYMGEFDIENFRQLPKEKLYIEIVERSRQLAADCALLKQAFHMSLHFKILRDRKCLQAYIDKWNGEVLYAFSKGELTVLNRKTRRGLHFAGLRINGLCLKPVIGTGIKFPRRSIG